MKKTKAIALGILALIAMLIGVTTFGVEGLLAIATVVPLAFMSDVPDLTEKDKKFGQAILDKMNELATKANLGMVSKEYADGEIKRLTDAINEVKALADHKGLQDQIDTMAKEMKHMQIGQVKEQAKSFIQQIKEALTPDMLKRLEKGEKVAMELKVAATMLISSQLTGDVERIDRKPDAIWLPDSMPMLSTILPSVPTNGNSVEIVEAYDEQGAPVFHIEGDAGAQMSWKWRTKRFDVKDVSVWAKFSKNILDDVDNFLGQVQTKLFNRLDKAIDAKLMAGDEAGNPEEVNGLVTIATAFTNNSIKTYKPSERDVLVAAVGQIAAYDHAANTVVMNPLDITKLKLAKAGKDNAILQFEDVGNALAGLRVVTSTRMTAGKFLVFDSSKAIQHVRMGLELTSTDADGSDFTKRLITLNLTKRLALEVSVNNYKAFVYGDFTVAKAAMALTT